MIKVNTVQFGMDAEILLRTRQGHPIPVCGLFGGTKAEPKPIEGLSGKGFFVQEDNAAAEFNIPPTNKFTRFGSHTSLAISALSTKLPAGLMFDEKNSSLVFNDEYLKIPAMQVFGCEPDYNAYTITANPRPNPEQPGLRTAAAHVHISWENPTDEDKLELVRLSDVFVVLPNLAGENSADSRRRKMYGKAGSFRPKSYGLEHRVLPNGWIFNRNDINKRLQGYADAIAALNSGLVVEKADYGKIINAIDAPHKKLAVRLYEKYRQKFLDLVGPHWSYADFYTNFY